MTADVANPVQIEFAIRHCADRIAKGVRVCSDHYAAKLAAERDLGRRGECAVTREYLRCTQDRSQVTCPIGWPAVRAAAYRRCRRCQP